MFRLSPVLKVLQFLSNWSTLCSIHFYSNHFYIYLYKILNKGIIKWNIDEIAFYKKRRRKNKSKFLRAWDLDIFCPWNWHNAWTRTYCVMCRFCSACWSARRRAPPRGPPQCAASTWTSPLPSFKQGSGPGFWPNSDPGLCTSSEGRF